MKCRKKTKNVAVIIFFQLVYFLILFFIKELLNILIIYYLRPNHTIINDEINVFEAQIIYRKIENPELNIKDSDKYYTFIPFVFQMLCLLFYFEILELNFCKLNKNTVKNIQMRERNEGSDEYESKEGRDSINNNKIELVGQYYLEGDKEETNEDNNVYRNEENEIEDNINNNEENENNNKIKNETSINNNSSIYNDKNEINCNIKLNTNIENNSNKKSIIENTKDKILNNKSNKNCFEKNTKKLKRKGSSAKNIHKIKNKNFEFDIGNNKLTSYFLFNLQREKLLNNHNTMEFIRKKNRKLKI